MSARTYRELRVWRLCRDLRDRVIAISATPAIARDGTFCNQLVSAASSPCTHIADGFGRFRSRDFARVLRVARASLNELMEHLGGGVSRGLIFQDEHDELAGRAREAGRAITQLIRYLEQPDGTAIGARPEADV